MIFVKLIGGEYLDGAFVIEFTVMPQLDSGKAEDVELIVDTLARSLKLEADDSVIKSGDGCSPHGWAYAVMSVDYYFCFRWFSIVLKASGGTFFKFAA